MNSIEMIFKYWWKSRKNFLISLIFQVASTIFILLTPVYIGRLVGELNPNNAIPPTAGILLTDFFMIVGLALLAFLTGRYGRIRSAKVAARALYYIRADIHNAIYKQSFAYFDKIETGQLVARATSDVEQTTPIFSMGLVIGLQAFLQIIGVLFTSLLLDYKLGWIFLIVIPVSMVLSLYITAKLRPIFLKTRESFGFLTNTIRENIVGAQVVRMFSTQEKERRKFGKNNKEFYNASVDTVKYSSFYMPMNLILIAIAVILVLFVGGHYVINGSMPLSILITFQSYIGVIMFPLTMFGQILVMYVQANAALVRVAEVLESTPEIKDALDAIPVENMKGNIQFDNVSFGYTSSNRILKSLSFKVDQGKKLAILGTTGSGKSTIINLLPRFYDVNEGTIFIDGTDIRRYKIEDLRHQIGVVSQDTFLFNKSIKDNIRFGRENATMEEIIEVAKSADLHGFIMTLPEKYDTIVGERGTRLSGGQKQRLSIARALIIKPKILILDDSTSSVDVETEYKIQNALNSLMKGTTTIIITQRISTIRHADNIMILDKGRIVGFGIHDELIKNNVLYKQIYETLYRKQNELNMTNQELDLVDIDKEVE